MADLVRHLNLDLEVEFVPGKRPYHIKQVRFGTFEDVVAVFKWCEQTFGPGGRSRKLRWRMGWTDKDDTYYFKSSKDAMMFTLRWSDAG